MLNIYNTKINNQQITDTVKSEKILTKDVLTTFVHNLNPKSNKQKKVPVAYNMFTAPTRKNIHVHLSCLANQYNAQCKLIHDIEEKLVTENHVLEQINVLKIELSNKKTTLKINKKNSTQLNKLITKYTNLINKRTEKGSIDDKLSELNRQLYSTSMTKSNLSSVILSEQIDIRNLNVRINAMTSCINKIIRSYELALSKLTETKNELEKEINCEYKIDRFGPSLRSRFEDMKRIVIDYKKNKHDLENSMNADNNDLKMLNVIGLNNSNELEPKNEISVSSIEKCVEIKKDLEVKDD